MRKILNNKKDMTMLYEFILLVAVISVVALLVFQINDDARDDIIEQDRATGSIANESVTISTAGTSLASATLRDVTCSNFIVLNATNTLIPSTNYTTTNCVISNSTCSVDGCSGTWKVSYSTEYSADSTRYNATIQNDSAVAKIPQSLKLLATAIIFGAVLYVILRVIPMRTKASPLQ